MRHSAYSHDESGRRRVWFCVPASRWVPSCGAERRRTHRPVPRLREPGDRRPRRARRRPLRLHPDRRRAGRARAGGHPARVRRLVLLRRGPPAAGPGPGRADRDPAAARGLPQERRRHQDGRRRHPARLRARVHHHVRHLHRRLGLHPARAQAARAGQAGDRDRRAVLDVGAAATGLRRVPVLRPAARGRPGTGPPRHPGPVRGPGRRAGGRPGRPAGRTGGPGRSRRPPPTPATTISVRWSPRP